MWLRSTLSALWLATLAWGAVSTDEDGTVRSIGVRRIANIHSHQLLIDR